jgi:hypothetical protein
VTDEREFLRPNAGAHLGRDGAELGRGQSAGIEFVDDHLRVDQAFDGERDLEVTLAAERRVVHELVDGQAVDPVRRSQCHSARAA